MNHSQKRKYFKSGNFTKENIWKRKMNKIFDRSKKLYENINEDLDEKLVKLRKSIKEVKEKIKPQIYKSGKRKYIKSGNYTKDALLERKITKILERFDKIKKESSEEKEKSWFQELKKK